MKKPRVGLWMIGARGGIASTLATGLASLQRDAVGTVGLVTCLQQFSDIGLVSFDNVVLGGHEIRQSSLYENAQSLWTKSRAIAPELIEGSKSFYDEVDQRIRPGTTIGVGEKIQQLSELSDSCSRESGHEAIARLRNDLLQFIQSEDLLSIIVINIASTEPKESRPLPDSFGELEKLLADQDECRLPASSIYFLAAASVGASYVNFTPSLGGTPQVLQAHAIDCGVALAGCDGKSGETMLKSVLAPMFVNRNLEVLSWVGHNILGNLDGWVLDDARNKETKLRSKDQVLGNILGYSPQTHVSIEHIESVGDWKTAWNHIHFRGFLGTPMTLQLTWQGADSVLAAPMVLDLFRLVERASRDGEVGALDWLACFFKQPMGRVNHDFQAQVLMLHQWVESKKA